MTLESSKIFTLRGRAGGVPYRTAMKIKLGGPKTQMFAEKLKSFYSTRAFLPGEWPNGSSQGHKSVYMRISETS